MKISEIKSMNEADERVFWTKATAKQLREILDNENLGGGISGWNKETLTRAISDLMEGIESDLVKKLKPKRITNKNKPNNKQLIDVKLVAVNIEIEEVEKETGNTEEEKLFNEILKTSTNLEENSWIMIADKYLFFFREDMDAKEHRKIYRRLVKYYHPDNQSTGDESKFKVIQSAWDFVQEYKGMCVTDEEWDNMGKWD